MLAWEGMLVEQRPETESQGPIPGQTEEKEERSNWQGSWLGTIPRELLIGSPVPIPLQAAFPDS